MFFDKYYKFHNALFCSSDLFFSPAKYFR